MSTTESPLSAQKRRLIIYAVFLFIVSCGLPMFLYTTLIYRAELPSSEIESKYAEFRDTVQFRVPIHVDIPLGDEFLLQDVENMLNQRVRGEFHLGNTTRYELTSEQLTDGYLVKLEETKDSEGFEVSKNSKDITLKSSEPRLSAKLAGLLVDLVVNVFREELSSLSTILHNQKDLNSELVIPFSDTYNVVFNLFVENGKPVEWEIEQAMKKLEPVFRALKHYSNFKISTQIQYYSKLRTEPVLDELQNAYIIKKEDLSTFINFGDWNLNNNDKFPSINFLVFFSESNYKNKPLLIEDSTTNSFLVPQWGGVHIYNKNMPILDGSTVKITEVELDEVLKVFASQLFDLLGVPKAPKSPIVRIDSLHRIRTFKNLKSSLENLRSLIKLTESLNEISVPEQTRTHVLEALEYYERSVSALKKLDFASAVEYSSQSVENSNKAFFEKEMVQQAYFPSEHKLAVFLPLLGPLCTIVTLGLIKTLKDRKKDDSEVELKKQI